METWHRFCTSAPVDVDGGVQEDTAEAMAIEERILRYFADHPCAADTAQGVLQWWLGDLVCSLDEVEAALQRLVDAGAIVARTVGDGSIVYARRDDDASKA